MVKKYEQRLIELSQKMRDSGAISPLRRAHLDSFLEEIMQTISLMIDEEGPRINTFVAFEFARTLGLRYSAIYNSMFNCSKTKLIFKDKYNLDSISLKEGAEKIYGQIDEFKFDKKNGINKRSKILFKDKISLENYIKDYTSDRKITLLHIYNMK